jgi:serine/threonine-protein kinase
MREGMDHKASELAMADVDALSRPDPLVGSIVNGKFHVRSAIARGGMGRIYFATQVPLERPVALKVVQADGDREHESHFLRRFLQEASILAKLQHPNVVTLFDYGKIEGSAVERYFIAMEYLAGETLAHRLAARAPLPSSEALALFRQIARGLREAHARGIVHRDLKPSNIILVPEGDGGELVKLVDFGIGKVLERGAGNDDLTQDGMMVGTPKYMAPEQFEGTASPASDLYSLGTILYQALTNRLPFQGNSLAEFMVAKFAHPVPRLRDVNPSCDASERLEALVLRLLLRVPEQRPTLDDIFSQLAACEEETFGTSAGRRMATGGYMAVLSATGGSATPAPMLPPPNTGVYAMAPASTPSPQSSLRVPHTIVASAPPAATGMPTFTPRPMATSTTPSATPKAGGAGLGAAVAMAVLLVGGGALYFARGALRGGPPDASTAAQTGTGQTVQTGPSAQTGPTGSGPSATPSFVPNAADATAFSIALDSNPPGANVYEGERLVGITPMQLKVERSSVSREPRAFVLKKDGYANATVVQGPSDGDVRSVVALAVDPAAGGKKPSGAAPRVTGGGTKPTTTATGAGNANATGSPPGTDIRLTR